MFRIFHCVLISYLIFEQNILNSYISAEDMNWIFSSNPLPTDDRVLSHKKDKYCIPQNALTHERLIAYSVRKRKKHEKIKECSGVIAWTKRYVWFVSQRETFVDVVYTSGIPYAQRGLFFLRKYSRKRYQPRCKLTTRRSVLCPVHPEKNPSATLYPNGGLYCFHEKKWYWPHQFKMTEELAGFFILS